jgi:hypothetical protein
MSWGRPPAPRLKTIPKVFRRPRRPRDGWQREHSDRPHPFNRDVSPRCPPYSMMTVDIPTTGKEYLQ